MDSRMPSASEGQGYDGSTSSLTDLCCVWTAILGTSTLHAAYDGIQSPDHLHQQPGFDLSARVIWTVEVDRYFCLSFSIE